MCNKYSIFHFDKKNYKISSPFFMYAFIWYYNEKEKIWVYKRLRRHCNVHSPRLPVCCPFPRRWGRSSRPAGAAEPAGSCRAQSSTPPLWRAVKMGREIEREKKRLEVKEQKNGKDTLDNPLIVLFSAYRAGIIHWLIFFFPRKERSRGITSVLHICTLSSRSTYRHVFGRCEKTGEPWGNPHRETGTTDSNVSLGSNQRPWTYESTHPVQLRAFTRKKKIILILTQNWFKSRTGRGTSMKAVCYLRKI